MSFYELEAIMDNLYLVDKSDWERIRSLSYIIAQGNSTKKLTPEKIMKFPWDDEESGEHTRLSEEKKKEFDEAWKREEARLQKIMKKH